MGYNVVFLLIGMMVIISMVQEAGLFGVWAMWRRCKLIPRRFAFSSCWRS